MTLFISKSPFRISLIGGGSDYEHWFSHRIGQSITIAINQGCVVSYNENPLNDFNYTFAYSTFEQCNDSDDIKHPLLRAFVKHYGVKRLEMHYDASLTKGTGLGTSSAFSNALVAAHYKSLSSESCKVQTAVESVNLERNIMQEHGGVQDQYATAIGGVNLNTFYPTHVSATRFILSNECKSILNSNMTLIVSKRSPDKVKHEASLKSLEDHDNQAYLEKTLELMPQFIDSLSSGNIALMRSLLTQAYELKLKFSGIHNDMTEEMSSFLFANNISHKICGSGSGGAIFCFHSLEEVSAVVSTSPSLFENVNAIISCEINDIGTIATPLF